MLGLHIILCLEARYASWTAECEFLLGRGEGKARAGPNESEGGMLGARWRDVSLRWGICTGPTERRGEETREDELCLGLRKGWQYRLW